MARVDTSTVERAALGLLKSFHNRDIQMSLVGVFMNLVSFKGISLAYLCV